MNKTKITFLFLAFVLPVGIFVFLKLFGRNEFDVPPLYVHDAPPKLSGCVAASHPYHVPDSIRASYTSANDSLTIIYFQPLTSEGLNQLDRVREQTAHDPVRLTAGELSTASAVVDSASVRRCAFFLDGAVNVVMIDKRGLIRGQYTADDREEIDRLLTEVTILLKKY